MCESKGECIPSTDEDILRLFVRHGYDCGAEKIYDALIARLATFKEIFPLKVEQKHLDMLQKGIMYVGGRDRQYRPFIVIQPAILIALNPEPMDAITCIFLNMLFVNKNMLLDGRIENIINLNN